MLFRSFPNTAPGNFTWCEEMHKWVLTTFHDYQWDLNYANPAVFVDMTKSILHLANLGVEVFRIDAVPYIWKQLGTTCQKDLKLNTWLSKEHIIRTKILPYFKKRKLSEITARDVIDWQNEIRQHTKSSGESYSPDYLKNVHTQLSLSLIHI